METARVLIAMSNDAAIMKLKTLLMERGYTIVDYAKDGHECLRKVRALRPDLIVVDYSLPLSNGFEVAKVVVEDKLSDIILITTADQEGLIDSLRGKNGFTSMTKPLNRSGLMNTIDLMVANSKKIKELEKEIEELKTSLNTRKEVERAKGLLMKQLSLSEDEAFKKIQKQSMDRGIPMKEIARAIILAYDI